MVRRNDKVAFMAGAFVFPGGRVDEGDQSPPGTAMRPATFSDLSDAEEAAYRTAAVRELHEEANVSITVDDLVPLAHWVTPEIEIRRYDTRFFLARMPEGQEARYDNSETTAQAWLTPKEALDQASAGSILLPPPTWTTLRQLERSASVDALWSWATRRSWPVQPA